MAKRERRSAWIVEFEHSTGWIPFEAGPQRHSALELVRRWASKHPNFKYRARRYIPAPEKPKAPKRASVRAKGSR